MKKVMGLLITLSMMNSCQSDLKEIEKSYMDLAVIRDKTDPHLLKPDANSVLRLFNLSDNNSAGVNFRYHEIKDRTLVPVVILNLPSGTSRGKSDEPFSRERLIINFYDTIRKTLTDVNSNNDSSFLDHSECFSTIAGELTILSQSNSQYKILLVFSNLFENSEILSVYNNDTKKMLMKTPNKIKEQFEKSKLLPEKLSNVRIVFLFNPATREEDMEYMKMIEVYRMLLEPRGAKVTVQANNSYAM